MPGRHNIINGLGAAAIALELGVGFTTVKKALASFQGAKRRFEILAHQPFMVVDDYAHHPTEIRATLETAKGIGGARVIAVFQPHRYTRTKYFLQEFATAFKDADIVIIDDIFAASEQPLAGISGQFLAEMVAANHQGLVKHLPGRQAIISWVDENWRPGDIYMVMGAGDIFKVGEELALFFQPSLAGKELKSVE